MTKFGTHLSPQLGGVGGRQSLPCRIAVALPASLAARGDRGLTNRTDLIAKRAVVPAGVARVQRLRWAFGFQFWGRGAAPRVMWWHLVGRAGRPGLLDLTWVPRWVLWPPGLVPRSLNTLLMNELVSVAHHWGPCRINSSTEAGHGCQFCCASGRASTLFPPCYIFRHVLLFYLFFVISGDSPVFEHQLFTS